MSSGRSHYELLSVDPSAGPAAIRAAFRQQIARYHPDKVIHLGVEFQELAERKTAELTSAYNTLIDPARRLQYDASLAAGRASAAGGDARLETDRSPTPRFAAERAGGDDIIQRALIGRVRSVFVDLYGPAESPRVRGFDLALVPVASPALMRSPFPRVFVKLTDAIDATLVSGACTEAMRAGLHVPGSPLNVLLFARRLNDESRIVEACEVVRTGRSASVAPKTHVVVIDAADWRALFASIVPPALRRFIDRLRT
jgi:hypothetical protein